MRAPDGTGLELGVAILAAGRSSRMGRPKLLLPWGGTSILGHLLNRWQALAEQVAAVCAPDDAALRAELERLGFPLQHCIYNASPERGMFSSVQCAARWSRWRPGLTHWCIVLGDQPHLRPETLRRLLAFACSHPESICQPSCGSRSRHPVLMPRAAFNQLATTQARDLRDFLSRQKIATVELDDPGLALDIDRPEDYRRALELLKTS